MTIETNEGPKEITSSVLSQDFKALCLLDEGANLVCEVVNPFPPQQDFPLLNYQIAVFSHQSWPESRVLVLEEDKRKVGHLFSSETLSSQSVALSSVKYAELAGYLALQKLCLGQTLNAVNLGRVTLGQRVGIEEIFPENSVIAIISNERRMELSSPGADLNDYLRLRLAAFGQWGLFLRQESGSSVTFDGLSNAPPEDANRLHLRPYGEHLPESARVVLRNIVLGIAPFERHPAFRFFLAYQFFEALMEELRVGYTGSFTARVTAGVTSSAQWELIEKFREVTTGKARLRLIGKNANGALYQTLMDDCNRVLRGIGREPKDSCLSALYEMRNILFHRFSDASNLSDDIAKAGDTLLLVICEMALSYLPPDVGL